MTSAAETKFSMDANGNWIAIDVIRTRLGKGWIETPVLSPSDRAIQKNAA